MPLFKDQLGREVFIKSSPKRIVSTVPSQTELLFALGLEKEVVGITAYCVHPPHWLSEKKVIGGTKDLNISLIRALEPDLIICNKEENPKEQIETLAKEFPVWISDVVSLESALEMIAEVGSICGRSEKASELISEIAQLRSNTEKLPPLKFLYFIWKDPYMVAGADSFISKMLEEAGLQNAAPENGSRYPQISSNEIEQTDAEIILLSSEPYKFVTKDALHFTALSHKPLIKIVDGEYLSWYGSRILLYFKYLPTFICEIKLKFRLK